MSIEIFTSRLKLREFRDSDKQDLFRIFNNKSFKFHGVCASQKAANAYVDKKIKNNSFRADINKRLGFNLVIESKKTSVIIGYVGAGCSPPLPSYMEGFYEWGFFCAVEHQGQGYVSEAAVKLKEYLVKQEGIEKFCATVHPDNKSSIRILERLGLSGRRLLNDEELSSRYSEPRLFFTN